MLAATVIMTVPFPLPFDPEEMVIHDAPSEAVHMQPAGAVTITER